MVCVLVDAKHLAAVSVVSAENAGWGEAKVSFKITSKVSHRWKVFECWPRVPPRVDRETLLRRAWDDLLSRSVDDMRAFVAESCEFPTHMDTLATFPWGEDDATRTVDAGLISGMLEGEHIRPHSVPSDRIASVDASKLVGHIHPERMPRTGLDYDTISGELDGRKIASGSVPPDALSRVPAEIISGQLTSAVTLLPGSVQDDQLTTVSAHKLVGAPPPRFSQMLDIGQMTGRLRLDQIPDSIPADKFDCSSLSLESFTKGRLRSNQIEKSSICDQHILDVNASKISGSIDGGCIAEGSIPADRLEHIDGRKVRGDMFVDDVSCVNIDVRKLESLGAEFDDAIVSDSVSTVLLEVHGNLWSTNATVGSLSCPTADINSVVSKSASISKIRADEVNADLVSCGKLEAGNAAFEMLHSRAIRADTSRVDEMSCRSIKGVSLECDALCSSEVYSSSVVAQSISADRIDAHSIDANDLRAQSTTMHEARANVVMSDTFDCAGDMTVGAIAARQARFETIVSRSLSVEGCLSADRLHFSRGLCADAASIRSLTAGQLFSHSMSVDSLHIGKKMSINTLIATSIECERLCTSGRHDVRELVASSVESRRLAVSDLESTNIATDRVSVSGSISCDNVVSSSLTSKVARSSRLRADFVSADDIILGGVSIRDAIADLRERIDHSKRVVDRRLPIHFDKIVAYADTVHEGTHDAFVASSPAFPGSPITLSFVGEGIPGITMSATGRLFGAADSPGTFRVNIGAEVRGPDSYEEQWRLTRTVEVRVLGPPTWPTGPLEIFATPDTLFHVDLDAEGSSSFSVEQAENGNFPGSVSVQDSLLTGQLTSVGSFVRVLTATAPVMPHTDRLLKSDRDAVFLVAPHAPRMVGEVIWKAGVHTSLRVDAEPDTTVSGDGRWTVSTSSTTTPDANVRWMSSENIEPGETATVVVQESTGYVNVRLLDISEDVHEFDIVDFGTMPAHFSLCRSDSSVPWSISGEQNVPIVFECTVRASGASGGVRADAIIIVQVANNSELP